MPSGLTLALLEGKKSIFVFTFINESQLPNGTAPANGDWKIIFLYGSQLIECWGTPIIVLGFPRVHFNWGSYIQDNRGKS